MLQFLFLLQCFKFLTSPMLCATFS
uniref:Uncharacterized protein n=1 Tax=Arundo donax TaxID=35708 RepID=A0A0A9H1M1_ARUDO